jgi:hypothetical protein
LDDGPGAPRSDPGFGERAWAESGEDRVGAFDGGGERIDVGSRQVGGNDSNLRRKLARVADDGGDVATRPLDALADAATQLLTESAAGQ